MVQPIRELSELEPVLFYHQQSTINQLLTMYAPESRVFAVPRGVISPAPTLQFPCKSPVTNHQSPTPISSQLQSSPTHRR